MCHMFSLGMKHFRRWKILLNRIPQKNISYDQKIFNYRLCQTHRVVENVFGILISRFRIFLQPINISVDGIDILILACCALHIFLRKTSKSNYITEKCVDREDIDNGNIIPAEWRLQTGSGIWKKQIQQMLVLLQKNVRESYKKYFNTVGRVSFQHWMVK